MTTAIFARFLTMFLVPAWSEGVPYSDELSVVTRELLRWLLFRLMFASGVVKLTSNCPTWWGLTALDYHFETQPLPTPFSRYAHFLPDILKKFGTSGTFIVEIFIPIFFYSPVRTLRIFAGIIQIIFQITIILTGNYTFFNLLTAALAITLFDDEFLQAYTSRVIKWFTGVMSIPTFSAQTYKKPEQSTWGNTLFIHLQWIIVLVALFVLYFPPNSIQTGKLIFDMQYLRKHVINSFYLHYSLYASVIYTFYQIIRYSYQNDFVLGINYFFSWARKFFAVLFFALIFLTTLAPFFRGISADINTLPIQSRYLEAVTSLSSPYQITNPYGLFRRMTGVGGRPELIIQGSVNGKDWSDYEFYYKPGNLSVQSKFNMPHQPRLDWQMWFAALSEINQQHWLIHLVIKLFSNSPNSLTLIKTNPFESQTPNYIRVLRYKYAFSPLDSTDEWVILNPKNPETYLAPLARDEPALRDFLKQLEFRPMNAKTYPVHPLQSIPLVPIVVTVLLALFFRNAISGFWQRGKDSQAEK